MTITQEQAVAALEAAKDDIAALTKAIDAASFLDDFPGDNRQKLRAARKKLRELHRAAAAAAAAEAEAAAANRSPHAKEHYDTSEFDTLVGQYDGLKWKLISKPGGAAVKPPEYYRLYGLHMQATQGDNRGERPMWAERGGLDFEGRAKWDAWQEFKGWDAERAKLSFVKVYWEFSPAALYQDTRGGTA